MAIQCAKAFGASHVTSVGEYGERSQLLGANTTVTTDEFLKGALLAEGKGTYDHVFDCKGGFKVWDVAHDLLRPGTGTFLSGGFWHVVL